MGSASRRVGRNPEEPSLANPGPVQVSSLVPKEKNPAVMAASEISIIVPTLEFGSLTLRLSFCELNSLDLRSSNSRVTDAGTATMVARALDSLRAEHKSCLVITTALIPIFLR